MLIQPRTCNFSWSALNPNRWNSKCIRYVGIDSSNFKQLVKYSGFKIAVSNMNSPYNETNVKLCRAATYFLQISTYGFFSALRTTHCVCNHIPWPGIIGVKACALQRLNKFHWILIALTNDGRVTLIHSDPELQRKKIERNEYESFTESFRQRSAGTIYLFAGTSIFYLKNY